MNTVVNEYIQLIPEKGVEIVILRAVKNLSIIYSRNPKSTVPPNPQVQPTADGVVLQYSIFTNEKYPRTSGSM